MNYRIFGVCLFWGIWQRWRFLLCSCADRIEGKMVLLTILKKLKQKEKEMRLLML